MEMFTSVPAVMCNNDVISMLYLFMNTIKRLVTVSPKKQWKIFLRYLMTFIIRTFPFLYDMQKYPDMTLISTDR